MSFGGDDMTEQGDLCADRAEGGLDEPEVAVGLLARRRGSAGKWDLCGASQDR